MSRSARLHADGLMRCPWPGEDPLYMAYHDTEWGVPEYDDRALYEKLILDGFQAGLSWITILRKRDNFRRAFDGFEPAKIALHAEKDREADAGCRHRAQPHEDRERGPLRARLSRRDGDRPRLLAAAVGLRRRQAEDQPLPLDVAGAGGHAGFAGDVEGGGEARLQLRLPEHRLRLHAGHRHGQRPRGELLPARGLGRAGRPLSAMPAKPRPVLSSEAFRAWQRMLSGRRLDLLDPSPLDVAMP